MLLAAREVVFLRYSLEKKSGSLLCIAGFWFLKASMNKALKLKLRSFFLPFFVVFLLGCFLVWFGFFAFWCIFIACNYTLPANGELVW